MNVIRAFFLGAFIGFALAVGMMLFFPIYEGQFPRTTDGLAAAARAINWFGVWLFTGLSAVGWSLHELRAVRRASDTYHEVSLWRDIWQLITFWRR